MPAESTDVTRDRVLPPPKRYISPSSKIHHPIMEASTLFPLRGLKRRGLFIEKKGGARVEKSPFLSFFLVFFSVAGVSGAHVGSMTVPRV